MPEHEKSNRPPPSLFDFLPSDLPSDDAPRPRGKKKGRRKKGSPTSDADAVAVPPTPEQDRALSAKPEEVN